MVAYEYDRVVGVSFGNSDFQAAIKKNVRKGEVFRAFPTCFSHVNVDYMMKWLRRSSAAKDILLIGSAAVRYAVRVKIYPYPAGAAAVWIIVAACTKGT